MRRAITCAVLVIAGLSYSFGFQNAWQLGRELGVPKWAAPVVAPGVDLSVTVLIIAIQFIRSNGVTDRLVGPRILLGFAGAATFALNAAQPISEHLYRRAAFDSVMPTLLIMWAEVAPALLTQLYAGPTVPQEKDDARTVLDEIGPLAALLKRAREVDTAHRESHGRGVTRDGLRAQLGISNAFAGELLRRVRTELQDGGTA